MMLEPASSLERNNLQEILQLHAAWLRGERGKRANLHGADLTGADLTGADLSGAGLSESDLTGADLAESDLAGADLAGADLRGANLHGADLRGANLRRADLRGANLAAANLRRADITGAELDDSTILTTGETWRVYLDTVLPRLCVAGGRPLAEVVAAWDCHEWDNCPMHVALGITGTYGLSGLPLLLRSRIEQFVQLHDAQLIPRSEIERHLGAMA